jgi:hypothetical protein
MTPETSGGATRPFDPTVTESSLFEAVGDVTQSDTTYGQPPQNEGNKFMQWIVRKWLQPSPGDRRNSLIEVSSSEQNEDDFDVETAVESKHQPNLLHPEVVTDVLPSPTSFAESNVSGRPRPLSQISQIYYQASPISSCEDSTQRSFSIISDGQNPPHPTFDNTLHPPSSTASNASPNQTPRRRRRQTTSGREMYHAL